MFRFQVSFFCMAVWLIYYGFYVISSGNESQLYPERVNIMATDALAPCVSKSTTAMILQM